MVQPHYKSFKDHKDALENIDEDNNLQAHSSDDSDTNDELGIVIDEVKKYFCDKSDLAGRYSNPEADQVQCPACNKTQCKNMFDVYQHCAT